MNTGNLIPIYPKQAKAPLRRRRPATTTVQQPTVIRLSTNPLQKLAWVFGFGR